jgi:hypothetical protein
MDKQEAEKLYTKAIEILKKNLTKEEFLKLQEIMDGDPFYEFFWALTEEAAKMAPKLFYYYPPKDEVEEDGL